jgi:hypothetical protein
MMALQTTHGDQNAKSLKKLAVSHQRFCHT